MGNDPFYGRIGVPNCTKRLGGMFTSTKKLKWCCEFSCISSNSMQFYKQCTHKNIQYIQLSQHSIQFPCSEQLPFPPEGAVRLQPGMGLPGHSKGFVKAGRRDQVHQAAQGEFQVIPEGKIFTRNGWEKKKTSPSWDGLTIWICHMTKIG